MKANLLRDLDSDLAPSISIEEMSLEQLKTAASNREPNAVAALSERMQADPAIWRDEGNPTRQLLARMLDALEFDQTIHHQLTLRFLDDLASQLARPEASVLERIVGERVLLAYVNLHLVHAKQLSLDDDLLNEQSLAVHEQMDRRLDSAYRNLDTALKGLRELRD